MKKFITVSFIIFLFAYSGIARKSNFRTVGQCTAFFKDGNVVTDVINFLSTRHPKIGFVDYDKYNLKNVWMLNFMNKKWDFPNERKRIKSQTDTIFLKNGQLFYDKIVTYSTKFKVFRFKKSNDIHVSKIKRIYLCCNKFPKFYRNNSDDTNQLNYTTFLLDGKTKDEKIKYYNNRKTGFVNGLQINSKDIVMINFENRKRNFTNEKKRLNRRYDTVFLNNGEYIQDIILRLDFNNGKIIFQDEPEINMNKVSRIYFKNKQNDNRNCVKQRIYQ